MKKVMAVAAGFLVAFVPAGTAFAGDIEVGKAYGNCGYNAVGGKVQLKGGSLSNEHGLGGFRKGVPCQDPLDELDEDEKGTGGENPDGPPMVLN